jgi:hypothetical protein
MPFSVAILSLLILFTVLCKSLFLWQLVHNPHVNLSPLAMPWAIETDNPRKDPYMPRLTKIHCVVLYWWMTQSPKQRHCSTKLSFDGVSFMKTIPATNPQLNLQMPHSGHTVQ